MTQFSKLNYCFALWMQRQPMGGLLVTWKDVAREWAVDRSTAYRWLNDYREAASWARDHLPA